MIMYRILMRWKRDSDGEYHDSELWPEFREKLIGLSGSYIQHGTAHAAGITTAGNRAEGAFSVYEFAVDPECVDCVRDLAEWVAAEFDQKHVLLQRIGTAELITKPLPTGETYHAS